MGAGHAHPHGLDERLRRDRRRLAPALALVGGVLILELVGGILAHSLALLADAAHMLTDAVSLAVALLAAAVSARPARGRWTFGLRRAEVVAAQANGIVLGVIGLLVVYAAVRRLLAPPDVHGGIVVGVALAGAAANAAAAALLASPSRDSLNMRAVFLHAATDVAAFAATAVAGLVILLTGWDRADGVASLCVAGLVLVSAAGLVRESTAVLLERAPVSIDPELVGRAIVDEPQVVEAHDLHVWEVTSGFPALSAHVLVEPGADCHAVRRSIERTLEARFGLAHTTLQVDHAAEPGEAVSLGRRLGRLAAPPR